MARYLRVAPSVTNRLKRLATPLSAVPANEMLLVRAETTDRESPIAKILDCIGERPILVVDPEHDDILVGVLASSDLL